MVDGGLVRNFPVQECQGMGADIIIVVDVSAPLASKEKIKSTLDITGQLTTIMTRRIADRQLKTLTGKDVLIIPGEQGISSSDFIRYPELIAEGERSARQHLDAIQRLSLSGNAGSPTSETR